MEVDNSWIYRPFTYKNLSTLDEVMNMFDEYNNSKENQIDPDINFDRLNIDDNPESLPKESQVSFSRQ